MAHTLQTALAQTPLVPPSLSASSREPSASVASTATVIAVPRAMAKLAATPAQKRPCVNANTSTRMAPVQGLMPTENTTAITLRQENGPTSFRASTIAHKPPHDDYEHDRVVVEMIAMVTAVTVHSVAPRTLGDLSALPPAPEAPELGDEQVQANQSNQRVTCAFKPVRPSIDLKPGGTQRDEKHADEDNRRSAWSPAAMKEMITPRRTVSHWRRRKKR